MRFIFSWILLLIFSNTVQSQQAYQPRAMQTEWAKQVNADNVWKQYPRPQLVRSSWKNLNGMWDYAIKPKGQTQPGTFDGKILVPFCVESSLSGVGKIVKPDQELWYRTSFTVPSEWNKKKLLLHFDAVDWETTVWINGKKAGSHKGGSDPFTIDISKFVKKGTQDMVISVWDPTDSGMQPRGKQVLDPKGIWYTPVTGIWQTVWLEPVDKTYIQSIVPEADIDAGKVVIKNVVAGANGKETMIVKVLKDGKVLSTTKGSSNKDLSISIPNADLWMPSHPALYHLQVELKSGGKLVDQVKTYFAMRKISVGKDEFGYQRLLLNNKPVFQYGTLDQGWWPDGLLTPPSEEAMRFDMDMLKDMGFNMLRKHIKVEPSRYYYYADSIGLLVWQDMPSGFQTAEREVQHVKAEAKEDWNRPAASAKQWEQEWKSIIDHLRFFPSIVVWVPFNEGWGQYDTKRVVEWTKKYDPTRVIDGVSGWTDRNTGDMNDAHHYPGPGMEPAEQNPGRVIVLGEFGGLGLPLEDHLWNPGMRNWGYRTYQSSDVLIKEYAKLMYNMYPMINRGLSAAVYTQTTDVEGEVNGLVTYDRKKVKIDPELMRILHEPLYNRQSTHSTALFKDAEATPQQILVTEKDPLLKAGSPVRARNFSTVSAPVNLKKGNNKWFLKTFTSEGDITNLQMRILANADIKVYLNGKLVLNKYINTKRHYDEINLSDFSDYIQKGENQLVVQVIDVKAESPFDVGLYTF